MADVQPENGYTRIADEILEQMAKVKLSPTQYRILFVVWRFTYGFNRKEHDLSLGFLSQATGCDKRQLQRELKGLEDRKIVFQKVMNGKGRKLMFNKNHDEWTGKSTIGETTIGEIDNGETADGENDNGTIGEIVKGTIGETDNQDIQKDKLIDIASSDYLKSPVSEIEKHFIQRRAKGTNVGNEDHLAMIELVEYGIPTDFIKSVVDKAYQEYKPKYPRDGITRFTYCVPRIYEEWHLAQERAKGGRAHEKPKGRVERIRSSGNSPSSGSSHEGESKVYKGKWDNTDIPMPKVSG